MTGEIAGQGAFRGPGAPRASSTSCRAGPGRRRPPPVPGLRRQRGTLGQLRNFTGCGVVVSTCRDRIATLDMRTEVGMRRMPRDIMRKLNLLIALMAGLAIPATGLFAAAPAMASSSSSVIADCNANGYLTGHYSSSQLQGALNGMGADVKEYTNCYDVVRRALLASASGGTGGSSGHGGGAARRHRRLERQQRRRRRQPWPAALGPLIPPSRPAASTTPSPAAPRPTRVHRTPSSSGGARSLPAARGSTPARACARSRCR